MCSNILTVSKMFMVVGFRVQPVAAGCIILWGVAVPLKQCPRLPVHKYSTHFADLGRMIG